MNVRERHYTAFKKLITSTFVDSFSNDSPSTTNLRISVSKHDYSLASITFLDYYKSFSTY
jgi:hypothetical protein